MVTHNIEEAVLLADRIVVLGANPGCIRGEVRVDIPRPRDKKGPRFVALVDYIYTVMTNPRAPVGELPSRRSRTVSRCCLMRASEASAVCSKSSTIAAGSEDLPKLAESLRLEVDDLLPAVDAAAMLGFAEVAHGDVTITAAGKEFATAGVHRSHEIFKEQLLKQRSLRHPRSIEAIRRRGTAASERSSCSIFWTSTSRTSEAEKQFQTLVDWGRYAQLFEYDADEERLYKAEEEISRRAVMVGRPILAAADFRGGSLGTTSLLKAGCSQHWPPYKVYVSD